jgi:hypothetical protein
LLAVSLGLLVIIAAVNVTLRIVYGIEKSRHESGDDRRGRVDSDMSSEITEIVRADRSLGINFTHIKKFSLLLIGGILIGVILPLLIGFAFQVVLISPLRHFQGGHVSPTGMTQSGGYARYAPIWIVGMMLLKIFVAIASIGNNGGIAPRLRVYVDTITITYERDGLISTQFSRSLFSGFMALAKPLIFRVFVPGFIVQLLNRGDVLSETGRVWGVPSILVCMWLRKVAIPGIVEFFHKQEKIIRDRKYLIRTELKNFIPPTSLPVGASTPPLPGEQGTKTPPLSDHIIQEVGAGGGLILIFLIKSAPISVRNVPSSKTPRFDRVINSSIKS